MLSHFPQLYLSLSSPISLTLFLFPLLFLPSLFSMPVVSSVTHKIWFIRIRRNVLLGNPPPPLPHSLLPQHFLQPKEAQRQHPLSWGKWLEVNGDLTAASCRERLPLPRFFQVRRTTVAVAILGCGKQQAGMTTQSLLLHAD